MGRRRSPRRRARRSCCARRVGHWLAPYEPLLRGTCLLGGGRPGLPFLAGAAWSGARRSVAVRRVRDRRCGAWSFRARACTRTAPSSCRRAPAPFAGGNPYVLHHSVLAGASAASFVGAQLNAVVRNCRLSRVASSGPTLGGSRRLRQACRQMLLPQGVERGRARPLATCQKVQPLQDGAR